MIDHVSRVLLLNPLPEVDLQLYGFYLEKKTIWRYNSAVRFARRWRTAL